MSTVVQLTNALFKEAGVKSQWIFSKPLDFSIKSSERWAIVGPAKTQMLKVLASQYNAEPPLSRVYPFLNKSIWPSSAIQFLEFKGVLPTAHLAARYEFFKDEFDQTTRKFVIGNVNNHRHINYKLVDEVFKKFKLQGLENRWALGLSNGQTRRARLARALVREPRLLVIDDPFLGLDPTASKTVCDVLGQLPPNPHVILGLRVQDPVPDWITHIAIVDSEGIVEQGTSQELKPHVENLKQDALRLQEQELKVQGESIAKIKKLFPVEQSQQRLNSNTPLLEFDGVSVAYRGQPVLKDLRWKVMPGERWHIQGNNGTGKSTLLSLITGEHPQSWNSKIIMHGVPRRTGKQSFFDINDSIGFTSPELHAIYPGHHTLYQTIATGFLVGSIMPQSKLSSREKEIIDTFIYEFDLKDKVDIPFRELDISDQKLALFIRSLVRNPELLILDEALSVMDEHTVQKCKELLRHYSGAILAIGHLQDEVPDTDRSIKLIEPGKFAII